MGLVSGSSERGRTAITTLAVLIALAGALVGIVYGYDQGSIASALLFLRPEFHMSPALTSVVVTAVPVGTLFGALAGGVIANAIGRKRSMMLIAIGYTVLSGAQGLAPSAEILALIRLLLGLVVGISIVAAPQFIAESAPTRIRGMLLVTFQTATNLGVMIAYWVGLALSPLETWRVILSAAAIPALIALIALWTLPDTARWYLMKGRREEAMRLIARVDPHADAGAEAAQIEEDMRITGAGRYRYLLKPPLRRAGIFVVFLGFLIQITGINAITYYSPTILESAGYRTPHQALLAAALIAIPGFIAVVASSFLVDRWGRRPTLLTGITAMGVANLLLLLSFATGPSKPLSIAGLIIFLVGFNFGYGALVWTYSAETLPAQMRAIGGSVLLTSDLFGNILIGFFFPNVIAHLGGAATFGILLVLSAFAFGFVFFMAPETKGRPLEQIREFWENGGKWPESTT